MAPNATPGSRKRGRPRNDESEPDTSTKKPRLDSSIVSKRATPGSLRSLSSAISGSFGYGERKVSTTGSIRKGRQPISKTWAIPESDNEERGPKDFKANGTLNPSVQRQNGNFDGVYDFQDSDEEPSPANTPSKKTRGAGSTGQASSTVPRSASITTKANGTRGKSDLLLRGSARGTQSAALETHTQRTHGDLRSAEVTASETEGYEDEHASDSEAVFTPATAKSRATSGGPLSRTNNVAPKLRGILTPSRRLSERNAKSVAFDELNANKDEIYFADLPTKSAKLNSSSQTRSYGKENKSLEDAAESEQDEGDDEVCAVCNMPESKPPNEIIFCDNCDMGVHQKCYGVARIPKGDWLCRNCAQDPSTGSGVSERHASLVAAEATPDIPNLEHHLRFLQRILLDRCTGKRQIKLRGQDEAYEKTFQLVEQTVVAGEGNSMLIIGTRGCGKTTVGTLLPNPVFATLY